MILLGGVVSIVTRIVWNNIPDESPQHARNLVERSGCEFWVGLQTRKWGIEPIVHVGRKLVVPRTKYISLLALIDILFTIFYPY